MQSVLITINVVGSNPAHGVVYSIQHYVLDGMEILKKNGNRGREWEYGEGREWEYGEGREGNGNISWR